MSDLRIKTPFDVSLYLNPIILNKLCSCLKEEKCFFFFALAKIFLPRINYLSLLSTFSHAYFWTQSNRQFKIDFNSLNKLSKKEEFIYLACSSILFPEIIRPLSTEFFPQLPLDNKKISINDIKLIANLRIFWSTNSPENSLQASNSFDVEKLLPTLLYQIIKETEEKKEKEKDFLFFILESLSNFLLICPPDYFKKEPKTKDKFLDFWARYSDEINILVNEVLSNFSQQGKKDFSKLVFCLYHLKIISAKEIIFYPEFCVD